MTVNFETFLTILTDPADLCNITTKTSLNLFHLNVLSANNKHVELEILLDNCAEKFHVIMLSETWYSNDCNFLSRIIIIIIFQTVQTNKKVVHTFMCCPVLLLAPLMNLQCEPPITKY